MHKWQFFSFFNEILVFLDNNVMISKSTFN